MKSKLGMVSLWVLVFLLGGVAGAISQYIYSKHLQKPMEGMPPKPMDPVEGMSRALKLDGKQKESVRTILNQTGQKFFELNKEFKPQYEAINKQYRPQFEKINKRYRERFEAIRNQSDEKIKKVLNADQRKQFEEFLKKFYAPPPGKKKPPAQPQK
jgi:uncharacterized membrane protein